jgi:molecular chaperone DnaK (HSP70)
MARKDFFINSVELIEFHGSTNIPTMLHYQKGIRNPSFGSEALNQAKVRDEVNEDFKVDLGNFRPGTTSPRQFPCSDGARRSAPELTGDFLNEVLREARLWLEARSLKSEVSILVAEPLSMQDSLVSENWLTNYRNSIRRLLSGKGFDKVDFLPEPFAVYQYYRHGERHPILAEQRKHYALVLDFGGGTFDVCVIETTKSGDVAAGGQMAKPLSASSKAIGGYFLNRMIAEHLIRKLLAPKNISSKLQKAFQEYARWRKEGSDLSALSSENQNFIKHFHRLTYRVEDAKLALSRSIRKWRLDSEETATVSVSVPSDPFFEESPAAHIQFSASDFRELFTKKIWTAELKQVVKLSLDRSRQESNGADISVVLLSGGSANIRWLAELLKRDFPAELSSAEILSIKDYQEVVSKGIAIECARRFYTTEGLGDFSAITYNRLCLVLDPDDAGYEIKRFTAKDAAMPKADIPGVLLPSASILANYRDKPMRWKVRLDSAPKRQLAYYFTKSSFDPGLVEHLHNVEETVVRTPRNAKFDSQISVELTVGHDGTATPRFVYYSGSLNEEGVSVSGRPFFLDMTSTESTAVARAYIGLDFGTSNSSVSFVNHELIQVFERRSQEESWADLSEMASTLPYPLAAPLASYRKETDSARLANAARDFIESALTLAAYISYIDLCSLERRSDSYYFKGFSSKKRSAGPLWGFLRDVSLKLGKRATFSKGFQGLVSSPFYDEINSAVDRIAQQKHGKADDSASHALRAVQILANNGRSVFSRSYFGVFQQVHKQRFGRNYEGMFRHAHGRPPFIQVSNYNGTIPFSNQETCLVDRETGQGVSLEPLILWHPCSKHQDLEDGHCFLFDCRESDGSFSYKAVGYTCTLTVSRTSTEMVGLFDQIQAMISKDPVISVFEIPLKDEPE